MKEYIYTAIMRIKGIAHIFAQNVTKHRKKKGFSQYDLADLSGISRRMIGHYEREGMIPPADDRNDLYRILNKMIRKNQLERQHLLGLAKNGLAKNGITKQHRLT